MARKQRRLRALEHELARVHPKVHDPRETILRGEVLVDGIVRTNPASLVRVNASITLRKSVALRGQAKLAFALETFDLDVRGRTGLDLGAGAGGFTLALLAAGIRRVFAVDVGHGQLLGTLRLDPRVVNLEATNLGAIDTRVVPDVVDVVVFDLSYLSLRDAVPQLSKVRIAPDADAIALIKPQFELRRADLPTLREELDDAARSAAEGFSSCGWNVIGIVDSPIPGARGAAELLLHAERGG